MALINFNFMSKSYRRQSNVTIILPTDGSDEMRSGKTIHVPGMKYQVLWLLHGGMGDDTDFINFSNIVRYANDHKIAVIMPAGVDFHEGKNYEYVTEELPQVLRTLLPLSDKREDNFIGGLSFGGDGAMRAVMEHPDRYTAALIMSAAGTEHHGENPPLRFDVYGLAEKLLSDGADIPKMIFASGSGDRGFPFYTPIIDKLDEMGLPVYRHYVDGDGHSWDFWDNTLKLALNELLPIKHSVILPDEA